MTAPGEPLRVLVVNAGSSSLKLAVLEGDRRIAETTIERWDGAGDVDPIRQFVDSTHEIAGVDAVGHRVVHGGARFSEPVRLDDGVVAYLDSIADLAPLHNPRAVDAIREVARLLPNLPAVACFDTAFHATMPDEARTYALPKEWNRRWGLRRFGFHGLSHRYAVGRAAELIHRPLPDLRVVSCHLGAGASLAAVLGGLSVDTTMGFTPLAGLVMATRSGSVDPGLVLWLLEKGGLDAVRLGEVLDHESGLKGLSGTSGDLRDVLASRDAGNADSALAFSVLVHRLAREVAAMTAATGGLDLLVLTGGMGEHSPELRRALAERLGYLGVEIDAEVNAATSGDRDISTPPALVRTVVVTASEDLEISREVRVVLGA